MTYDEAKERVSQIMADPSDGGCQAEAVSILYSVRMDIYYTKYCCCCGMPYDEYEDLFQDALLYTMQNYSVEESNGKSYFNYFRYILRCKRLDSLKKRRPDLSFDDPAGTDSDATVSDFVENPKYSSERMTGQVEAEEQILMIFHLAEQMTAMMNGNREEKRNALFRMFLTSRSVDAFRSVLSEDSGLFRHERDIMSSMDDSLLGYTYRDQPTTLREVICAALKRYGELLPDHPKAELPLDTPFINKVLCKYMQDCHGRTISEPALSQQEARFNEYLTSLCAG